MCYSDTHSCISVWKLLFLNEIYVIPECIHAFHGKGGMFLCNETALELGQEHAARVQSLHLVRWGSKGSWLEFCVIRNEEFPSRKAGVCSCEDVHCASLSRGTACLEWNGGAALGCCWLRAGVRFGWITSEAIGAPAVLSLCGS